MTTRIPQLASVLLVGALTLGLTAPALAAEDTSRTDTAADRVTDQTADRITDIKARCQAGIERRLVDLGATQERVAGVEAVTADHLATINSIIDRTQAGLADLSVAIASATTPEELRDLCMQIASSFRVYLVVLPQTHLTVGADRIDAAIDNGDELIERFDEAVEAAAAAGANVTEAVALRDSAVAHLDASESANETVAASALGVTAASYNEGPGEAALDSARSHLRTAHSELQEAIAAARAAVEALQRALAAID